MHPHLTAGVLLVRSAGTVTVLAIGISANALAGTLAGFVAAAVALVGLPLTIAANNRAKRAQYAGELASARAAGAAELRPLLERAERDAEFWRAAYVELRGPLPAERPPAPPSDA